MPAWVVMSDLLLFFIFRLALRCQPEACAADAANVRHAPRQNRMTNARLWGTLMTLMFHSPTKRDRLSYIYVVVEQAAPVFAFFRV